ncbi:MAG: hypothetical protein DCC75_04955 [Proteobacteria bacterium]|nr:MAG: hypothetical protein DCC75_04955 [Pseudomonadota bacterium]
MSNADPVIVEEVTTFESSYQTLEPTSEVLEEASPITARLNAIVLACLGMILPIWFGGVHAPLYLTAYFLVFTLVLVNLFSNSALLTRIFTHNAATRLVATGLLGFLIYCSLQYCAYFFFAIDHPVLGRISAIPDSSAFLSGVLSIGFFIGCFALFTIFLHSSKSSEARLLGFAKFMALTVSLIALSHWFSDNGKLFWTFEPENIFESKRARWPFVNSNHLAHFLLPLLLLVCAEIVLNFEKLKEIGVGSRSRARVRRPPAVSPAQVLSRIVLSSRAQSRVLNMSFGVILCLAALIAVLASLSRGGWLGLAIGAIFFVFCERLVKERSELGLPEDAAPLQEREVQAEFLEDGRRSRRRRGRTKAIDHAQQMLFILQRSFRPLLLILALFVLYLFLKGQGQDLILGRIDYGLMYSKDDMRWQMYSDTIPMIKENPVFGVGLGGWLTLFHSKMSPLLSGLDPVYLHSDPMQLLAECGLAGVLVFITPLVLVGVRAVSAIRQKSLSLATRTRLAGLLCGFSALVIASFLDFPFRIPAVCFMAASLLALTTFYIDSLSGVSSKNSSSNAPTPS